MALYDDLDTKQKTDQIDGWSSGIKLLQTQLAVKKVVPQRNIAPRKAITLAPVIDLKAKKEISEETFSNTQNEVHQIYPSLLKNVSQNIFGPTNQSRERSSDGVEWNVVDEYDPIWPNDYEKLVKVKRDKEKEKLREREERKREERNTKRKVSGVPRTTAEDESPPAKYLGFGGRRHAHSDDEDACSKSPPTARASLGAAIAPPPSLQENLVSEKSSAGNVTYGTSSVAAKIMAKYGFKDGQGLGKQEQGMSVALQVEKTSKRGGRIIHEKEFITPLSAASSPPPQSAEPSITEIMKSPSKVVILRNMVGPGDVDSELEPEVKDECNTKYGDVVTVVIHEVPDTNPEEAVRIFVEFKRIESAIKAVVDLNGRFFGGRQVKAGFYDFEKFQNLQLLG
ncbi:splicing factor 45 [Lutzomyia longipalpis]|uniref:Splicing factor 45 n=1 Tax=Lutzomyia longipalpis TaxID=7200 RepID=A0A1B0GL31_LUTLO|nr:splicing factor 45 [Lutzomyia longipalpis]